MKTIIDRENHIRIRYTDDNMIVAQTLRVPSQPEEEYTMKGCAVKMLTGMTEKEISDLTIWAKRHMFDEPAYGFAKSLDGRVHVKWYWDETWEKYDGSTETERHYGYDIFGFNWEVA